MFSCGNGHVNFDKINRWFKLPKGHNKNMLHMHKFKTIWANLFKRLLIDGLFFLFLMANIILLKGILDGSRSLYRFTIGCLVINLLTVTEDL